MTDITTRSDFDCDLVEMMGSDELICKAARVSTLGVESIDSKESAGLINFLMRNRHGSPFEHAAFVARITGPIFMWREFMRHRIGVSYNEQSGRYMELSPVFYVPPRERPLVQEGKPGAYTFVAGNEQQIGLTNSELTYSYRVAWESYQRMLGAGIAKEVARMCLPVGVYSTAYVTLNPRSLMHFLSLRTKHDDSTFKSYPQWEINQVANALEVFLKDSFPLTHDAFMNHGRVAP
jgi:thymidylate synthase (FAD)